jgi:hypothetical protein
VYVRQIDDQILTLRVSGKLWMRSLIMSDVETNTEWSHLLGRGMKGELKGRVLDPVVTDMVTWAAWREDFPETTVLDMPNTSQNYTRDFYRDSSRFVFGFRASGKTWALPMAELIRKPVHSFHIGDLSLLAALDKLGMVTHLFEATVGDQDLEFVQLDDETMQDKQTQSRWSIRRGKAIAGPLSGTELKQRVGIMSFRKAWQNFHPKSVDVRF